MTDTLTEPTAHWDMLRPNDQRAKNAITLLWIMLILEVIGFFSNYFQYALLSSPEITEQAAEANDTRQQIIGIAYLICFIISAVTFINWFRRAYYNLSLVDGYLSHSDKDAAISWFIPIISLYKPYQIMKELYRKTGYLLGDQDVETKENLSMGMLGVWWTLWFVNNVLGQISFRLTRDADRIDQLLSLTTLDMVINIVGIPLALLAILVVRRYAQAEELLSQLPDQHTELDTDVPTE